MSEARKHRSFTPEQKIEIVLAGLRGDRPVRDVCGPMRSAKPCITSGGSGCSRAKPRSALHGTRAAAGHGAGRGPQEDQPAGASTRPQDLRAGSGGGSIAGLGVNERVARSRALIARGHRPAVVTRVLQVSRQSVYRPISRRPAGAGPGRGRPGDEAIVEVARANPTDGTRMVAAIAGRELGAPVNRKRVQRVMRQHKLLQRSRNTDRLRRPGFFRLFMMIGCERWSSLTM